MFRKLMNLNQRFGQFLRLFKKVKGMDQDWNIEANIDENLGKYWECIPGMKQKRWFTKETHLQEHLKIKTLNDVSLQLLRTSKRGNKFISNIFNYDILQNQVYADLFFY
jgi:hypothetical protein